MPFGVDLPDNLGQEAPATDSQNASPNTQDLEVSSKAGQSEATGRDILDLDKLDRFRFEGREVSLKDLKDGYMMREDYTRKTQEVAEARKYAENFEADLSAVIKDPRLITELGRVYPKAYVDVARKVLERATGPSSQTSQTQTQSNPLEAKLSEIEGKFHALEQEKYQNEVKQIETQIDNWFQSLSKKYPHADPEVITARAQVAASNGTQITDDVLDRLFKANHNEIKDRFEKIYKEKVNKQLEASAKGKDIGTGGGTPGQAPRGYKTIKEATQAWLSEIAR